MLSLLFQLKQVPPWVWFGLFFDSAATGLLVEFQVISLNWRKKLYQYITTEQRQFILLLLYFSFFFLQTKRITAFCFFFFVSSIFFFGLNILFCVYCMCTKLNLRFNFVGRTTTIATQRKKKNNVKKIFFCIYISFFICINSKLNEYNIVCCIFVFLCYMCTRNVSFFVYFYIITSVFFFFYIWFQCERRNSTVMKYSTNDTSWAL